MSWVLAQAEPLIRWDWVSRNSDVIYQQAVEHIVLTAIAVTIGLIISLPLGILIHRRRSLYGPVTWVAGLLYTIPSLALFAFLVPYTGLTATTAEIGLVSYTLLILIRNTAAGLRGVPDDVKEAARGMGYSDRQILWKVELPLATPVIIAGIRIATVTTIGLVTVTSLIAQGGLGQLILIGLRRFFATAIIAGAFLSALLAVIADGSLLFVERWATPWARSRGPGELS